MKKLIATVSALAVVALTVGYTFAEAQRRDHEYHGTVDPRDIRSGHEIPSEKYCDQPYVVVTKDGNWLCVLTTSSGIEGSRGQHIVATNSMDQGKTWSAPVDIEPATGPLASWAMPLITPSGRVYVFYNYNGENVTIRRADCEGWYCYKYSDDNGKTWSKRYRLPMRLTDVDRNNDYQGKVQLFWGIGEPITYKNRAYFAFTKIGHEADYGKSEGWFYRSDNILRESDASRIEWQMLPDGQKGLRAAEHGSVQTEHNLVPMSNGDLYCVYRTTMGYPCHAYSRDGGHRWSKPEAITYRPGGGRKLKTPRACPRVWRTQNGNYLFWFHNHGTKNCWVGRNPAWIVGGVEREGRIYWSEPEILLYHPDPPRTSPGGGLGYWGGISYPDLIEQDGCYWVTATEKTTATVHEVDPALLDGMWNQGKSRTVAKKGLILSLEDVQTREVNMPRLPDLAKNGSFSIDLSIKLDDSSAGWVILDSRDKAGKGVVVKTADRDTVRIEISDGRNTAGWNSDAELMSANSWHHLVIIVDGGPNIITFVVDGVFCDGGTSRDFGWSRFSKDLGDVNGSARLKTAPGSKVRLKSLRLYDRYLRTSEAVANFRASNLVSIKNQRAEGQ